MSTVNHEAQLVLNILKLKDNESFNDITIKLNEGHGQVEANKVILCAGTPLFVFWENGVWRFESPGHFRFIAFNPHRLRSSDRNLRKLQMISKHQLKWVPPYMCMYNIDLINSK